MYIYSRQCSDAKCIQALWLSKILQKPKFMQRTLFSGAISLKDNAVLGRARTKIPVPRHSGFFQHGISHLETSFCSMPWLRGCHSRDCKISHAEIELKELLSLFEGDQEQTFQRCMKKKRLHAASTVLELVTAISHIFGKELLSLALPWGNSLILLEKSSSCS